MGQLVNKTALILGVALYTVASFASDIALPTPQTSGGMPLMDAMSARRSERTFSPRELDLQTVSNILWSAYGISSPDGKRTIPTARNLQNLQVYALTAQGAFLYDATGNKLVEITDKDLRPLLAEKQAYAGIAPLTLIFVGDGGKYDGMHAGSAYQNAALYCMSAGLNQVVRGLIDSEALAKELRLDNSQSVIVSLTIGRKPD